MDRNERTFTLPDKTRPKASKAEASERGISLVT
jgi:hypothetical protein